MKSAIKLRVEDLDHTPDDGNRYEIIDGALIVSPSPEALMQRVGFKLARILADYVDEIDAGEVWIAPFSIILDPWTILEADIVFVAKTNGSTLSKRGFEGAPDLVIEILSSSTAERDKTVKRQRYERAGVPHYWIVDPEAQTLTQYEPVDGVYTVMRVFGIDDVVESPLFPGFSTPLRKVFQQKGMPLNP